MLSKRKRLVLSALTVLILSCCSQLKYEREPGIEGYYRLLTLKLNVKESGSTRRGSGKIILKFDDKLSKMLFLSPLNQVYFQLYVQEERVLLINTKKRRYWRGKFNLLLKRLWGLDFHYKELQRLITDGVIPGGKVQKAGLAVSLETDKETEKPVRITITGPDVLLKLKVLNKKLKQGRMSYNPDLLSLRQSSLEAVLNGD